MIDSLLNTHKILFLNYAQKFLVSLESNTSDTKNKKNELKENIQLKINHTLNVLSLGQEIAKSENLSSEDFFLASLACLYHDIGRFHQLLKYGTFLDAKSENHALIGYNILQSENFLNEICEKDKEKILLAVKLHNEKELNFLEDKQTDTICKIVRDSDKIDILDILCDYHDKRENEKNNLLEIDLPDTNTYSQEIIDLIHKQKRIPNAIRKTYNDMKLIHLAWTFDLNFSYSFKIFKKRKYIERIASHLPQNEEIFDIVKQIQNFIDKKSAQN